MKLKPLMDLFYTDYTKFNRIRRRQQIGVMKKYIVDGKIAFDVDEYDNFKPRNAGRPPKGGIVVDNKGESEK